MMKIPLLGDFYSEIGWLFSPISYFQLHQQKPYAGMQGNYFMQGICSVNETALGASRVVREAR